MTVYCRIKIWILFVCDISLLRRDNSFIQVMICLFFSLISLIPNQRQLFTVTFRFFCIPNVMKEALVLSNGLRISTWDYGGALYTMVHLACEGDLLGVFYPDGGQPWLRYPKNTLSSRRVFQNRLKQCQNLFYRSIMMAQLYIWRTTLTLTPKSSK